MIIFEIGIVAALSPTLRGAPRVLQILWERHQQHPTFWNTCFLWAMIFGVLIYLIVESAKYIGTGRNKNKPVKPLSNQSSQTSDQNLNLQRSSEQKVDVVSIGTQAPQITVGESMHYWVIIGNEKKGPFTLEQLKRQDIHAASLVWREGTASWVVASSFAELAECVRQLPPPMPVDVVPKIAAHPVFPVSQSNRVVEKAYSPRDVYLIAKRQRWLILALAAMILFSVSSCLVWGAVIAVLEKIGTPTATIDTLFGSFMLLIIVGAMATQLTLSATLADRLRMLVWVWMILSLVPYVGMIALLVINQRAIKVLAAQGYRVGFFGVDGNTLAELAAKQET